MNFQKLIRSFYRMLFSNELILDDKKNAKKYLRLRLGAPYQSLSQNRPMRELLRF